MTPASVSLRSVSGAVLAAAAFVCAGAATAEPVTLQLYPGAAPGSEHATQIEVSRPGKTGRILRNVTVPTLTVYAPPVGKANGVGVIIAPGGGFHILSIDNEGTALGQWFAERGVTAFVLKYRLNQTSPIDAVAMVQLAQYLGTIKASPDGEPALTQGEMQATADAFEAMRLVRSRAASFGVDPHHIGFVGFSAGAMLALKVGTTPDASVRPNFMAAIYGALRTGLAPQADSPPVFIAAAADDTLLPGKSQPIYAAWKAKGLDAELHIYDQGGHGFGMTPEGKDSDRWLGDFSAWLEAHGWLVHR
jgi:acetyl esterase/lipase